MKTALLKAGESVFVVDDLLATGGTLAAAVELVSARIALTSLAKETSPFVSRINLSSPCSCSLQVKRCGAEVKGCMCVIGLPELNGAAKVGAPCHTLFNFAAGC